MEYRPGPVGGTITAYGASFEERPRRRRNQDRQIALRVTQETIDRAEKLAPIMQKRPEWGDRQNDRQRRDASGPTEGPRPARVRDEEQPPSLKPS